MDIITDAWGSVVDLLAVDFLGMDGGMRAVLFGGIFLIALTALLLTLYDGQEREDGDAFAVTAGVAIGCIMTLPALVVAAFNLETSRQGWVNPTGHLAVGGAVVALAAASAAFWLRRRADDDHEVAAAHARVAVRVDDTTRVVRRELDETRIERIAGFAEMAYLVELTGRRAGTIHRLRERTVIGREKSSAEIVLDDERVSRPHAAVRFEDGAFVLRDLDSANGTFLVNSGRARIDAAHRLEERDRIQIGGVTLSFLRVDPQVRARADERATASIGGR
jgi:hypothetical protein